MGRERTIVAAAVLGACGVLAGAFGAHALGASLEPGARTIYETAVRYHLVHAVAALSVGCGPTALWEEPWCARGCAAWFAGIALFAGSLYLLALGAPRWLGAITPLGGLALVAGWLAVALAASRAGRGARQPVP